MTQAIILAAGKGERLKTFIPKCLVSINEEILLKRCLDNLCTNNIKNVIIVTGYKADMIIKNIGGTYKNINISYLYNEKYENTNNCISLLKGLQIIDDDVLIIESDVIFDPDIIKELTSEKHKFSWAVDKFVEGMTGSALVTNREGRITSVKYLTEFKPKKYKSVGMVYIPVEYVKTLKMWLEDRDNDNQFYDNVIANHLAELPIYIKDISGKLWYEIDTQEDLEKARELFNGL